MAKTLELSFATDNGKVAKLTVDNPKEPIDQAAVKQAMDQIITSGIFYTVNGNFASSQGARVVERNVTDYQIV
jgi:hypothetical protein